MENKTNIFKDSYQELVERTTWPKWDDLQSNTVTVAAASVVFAVAIFMADKFFQLSVDSYFSIFK
ncbi:MAG: preprotein translocase subunit SecE [Chlamydiia bacterium]|nr:preprotein translocase subunit SecE [Chlamydiia bacterium]